MRAIFPLAVFILVSLTGCSLFTAKPRKCDLRTLESLGGIAIGRARVGAEGHVIVPILCDVSGTRAITTHPTRLESALVCAPPEVMIKEQVIWLTVKTCRPAKGLSSQCPEVDLGKLPKETYLVYYRDPDGSEQPIGIVMTKNLRF